MEKTINIPIQLISSCSTMGNITPIRFRMEHEDHSLETVNIDGIISHKDVNYNGIKEIQFTCRANIERDMRIFIICYNINSHKWRLFKMLV